MKKLWGAMGAAVVFALSGLTAQAGGISGREIMEKFDKVNRAKDEVIESTMYIISPTGQRRERKLTSFIKAGEGDDDRLLIRFLAPADVKGTGLLTIEKGDTDEQLLYLPELKKTRRIAGANKATSFVGSDFSNYDMRTEDMANHVYELVGEEEVAGRPCYKVEALPKDAATEEMTGYKKRFFYIDKERWVAHRIEYFDRSLKPLKVIISTEYEQVEGLWRANRAEVTNTQEGSKTVVVRSAERRINKGLDDSIFTRRNLEKP